MTEKTTAESFYLFRRSVNSDIW